MTVSLSVWIEENANFIHHFSSIVFMTNCLACLPVCLTSFSLSVFLKENKNLYHFSSVMSETVWSG